jgi:hypothetical protein
MVGLDSESNREIPNLKQYKGKKRGKAWFSVWLWQLVDKAEGMRG